MTKRLPIVIAALALAGCGGSSEPAEPPPPSPQPGGQSAGERADATDTRALRTAAAEEFGTPDGEASWWELVTATHVDHGRAEITTSIPGGTRADDAGQICRGFLELLPRIELEDVTQVLVLDRDEQTLTLCSR